MTNRVLRGGSWNNNARNCRSANRNRNTPDNRNNNNGFRLVRASAAFLQACRIPAFQGGPEGARLKPFPCLLPVPV